MVFAEYHNDTLSLKTNQCKYRKLIFHSVAKIIQLRKESFFQPKKLYTVLLDYPFWILKSKILLLGFSCDPMAKHPPAKAGDTSSIPGPGRSHIPRGN